MGDSLRRQIVICCDGTNNTLTGRQRDTNVLRLHDHLARQDAQAGCERILYYDPGVGSPGMLPSAGPVEDLARTWKRLSGLASGSGVYENVAAAYVFLMRHWRDHGDRIYLFGFSRGAFTVRALAGMVNLFGIVRPEYEELVPTLVHIYFSPSDDHPAGLVQRSSRALHRRLTRTRPLVGTEDEAREENHHTREKLAEQVRTDFAGTDRARTWVHWIGVWDTVESVGLPGPLSRVNPTPPTFVGKRYRNVRHALCLDEHRWPFLPRLYEEPGDVDLPPPPGEGGPRQTLKQRWYPGVHCDVGGGYRNREAGIADAALRWMVDEVKSDLGIAPLPPLPAGASFWRHDAIWYMPLWALAGMTLRDMHPRLRRQGPHTRASFQAIPADNWPAAPIHSIWEKRRPWLPLLRALVLGFVFLVASGLCLLDGPEVQLKAHPLMTVVRAVQATQDFADQQLAALWGQGLMASGHRPWELIVQPGWAMFWDLLFVPCWAYLVARVGSRAFAWLAGDRKVRSRRPFWWRLGFAPMLAVGSDIAEDLCLWLSLAFHAAGTDLVALAFVWIGSLGSVLKFVGLAGCAVLLAVRCRILFNPSLLWPGAQSRYSDRETPPAHRGHTGDIFAAVALAFAALAVWGFSRLTICWGEYDHYGTLSCHSHLAAIALSLLALVPLWRFVRDLVRPTTLDADGLPTTRERSLREGMRHVGRRGVAGAASAALANLLLVALIVWLVVLTDILF